MKNIGDVDAASARMEARQASHRREAEAVSRVRAAGAVPERCGPEIPEAPARGPFQVFQPVEMVPGSALRARPAGWQGRDAIRMGDAFDVMAEQARRQKAAAPFTPGQVQAGRDYARLVERLDAAGVRCSSLEALAQRGGGGGSFVDAVLRDRQRLQAMRHRIGDGLAIEVRRVRPSDRGGVRRRAMSDRVLVDLVCVREKCLSEILRSFGWAASTKNRAALRAALCGALDRMQGYKLARPQNVG